MLISGLGTTTARANTSTAPAAPSFGNGALLRDQSTGRIYLYWDGSRQWIKDPPTLDALGYGGGNWTSLGSDQISAIPDGSTLALNTVGGLLYPLAPITSSQVTLDLSRPSAAAGSSLTLSGSGFQAGETVNIDAPDLVFNFDAGTSGSFTATVPVPSSVSPGLHHIFVHGEASGDFGVEVFHVIPSAVVQVALSAQEVHPGDSVGVSGAGFLPNEHVQVFVGTLVGDATNAGGDGAFGPLPVMLPAGAPTGMVTVIAFGVSSARFSQTQLSITTMPLPPASPTATATTLPTASPTGTATPAPTATGTSTAVTSSTATATATPSSTAFRPSSIAVTPYHVHPGSVVRVSGYHFKAGETIRIRFRGRLEQVAVAGHGGSFLNAVFFVPSDTPPGAATVSAIGTSSGRTASARLVVQGSHAHIILSPVIAHQGQLIAVVGDGFGPHEPVLLRLSGRIVQRATTDHRGDLHVWFRVPTYWPNGWFTLKAAALQTGVVVSASLRVLARVSVVVSVAPVHVRRPQWVTVTGHGFAARELVQLRMNGSLLLSTGTNSRGDFSAGFRVPRWMAHGSDRLVAWGARSHRQATETIVVA
jgi:hypothetical protein